MDSLKELEKIIREKVSIKLKKEIEDNWQSYARDITISDFNQACARFAIANPSNSVSQYHVMNLIQAQSILTPFLEDIVFENLINHKVSQEFNLIYKNTIQNSNNG